MEYPRETNPRAPLKYYRPLHRAAKKGDWKAAEEFLRRDPDSMTADITGFEETVLHAAAWAGNADFIQKLLIILQPDALEKRNYKGWTALQIAAIVGNLEIIKALEQKNPCLTRAMQVPGGPTPLLLAASYDHKEVVRYLYSKTKDEHPSLPFTGDQPGELILCLARSGYHDIVVSLIKDYPSMAAATITNSGEENLLSVLAARPGDFQSGSSLSLWEKCIYHLVPVELNEEVYPHKQILDCQKNPKLVACFAVLSQMDNLCWTVLKLLIPKIKHIIEEKLKHRSVETLVHWVCEKIDKDDENQILNYFSDTQIMREAAASGIVEIVTICLQYFPNLLWEHIDGTSIFHVAIEQRREKIFNLIGEGKAGSNLLAAAEDERSALHLVAELAPLPQLKSIPCSALQMQRELQWFKAVENFVEPKDRDLKNTEEQTASELFTIKHEKLAKEAEKWMKETSNYCMVGSTLIAAVAFAAAFTVPGGNRCDKGIPIFLNNASFAPFAISIALALFSSATSILMFLSILIARYAEKDFLFALPMRLILGLASLFIAIAAMMVAFGAALQIMLSEKWKWVYIPSMILGAIPVGLFMMLQLPLFFQMVWSTFGPSIFRPKSIW